MRTESVWSIRRVFEARSRVKRMLGIMAVALLAALAFSAPALAAPGDRDTSFGEDGRVITYFSESDFSSVNDLVVQPDGKIVATGAHLARYNPDGSLDPSFDGDGKIDASDQALTIQPDGKIVVAGTFTEETGGSFNSKFEVSRYNPDGSPDTTFDGDGRLTTPDGPGGADSASDVVVQPDGKIIVAGSSHDYNTGNTDMAVVRYNPDGSLDNSFDGDGKLTTDFESGNDYASSVALQPDGGIVVAGATGHTKDQYGVSTDSDFALARYNPDGSLDDSFGGDGKLTTSIAPLNDYVNALAIQPDGKIVVGGNSQNDTKGYNNPINDFALARYNPDGSLDTAFSEDGVLTTPIGSFSDTARDLALQPDGKIVVAGTAEKTVQSESTPAQTEFALARYNPGGSLDPLFGGDGKTTDFGSCCVDVGAVALQANGRIVVAGTSYEFTLARFYGGDDITAPGPVTAFTSSTQSRDISLSWENPTDGDFEATRILRSTADFADRFHQTSSQTKVYEGSATSHTDAGLTDNTRYYYTAFARDGTGNWSEIATRTAAADSLPPKTYMQSVPGSYTDTTPTFTFVGTDNLTLIEDLLYSYKVDDGEWSNYSSETSATLGGDEGLGDGSYTFYVRAKDEAGNATEPPRQHDFIVEARDPEITIHSGPSGTTSAGTASFEFSADEEVIEVQCGLDDDPDDSTNCASPKRFTGLGLGEHTFQVQGTDMFGNTGPIASRTWTIAPDTVSEEAQSGGAVTTDPQNNGTTPDNPVATSVTIPNGGSVSITETPAIGASPSGYSLLGQQVNITAPDATASDPLVLKFRLDASLIPAGENQNTLQIFRNGARVGDCADASGAASPNPCVSDRELLAGGDAEFTILTSQASRWNFGVDIAPPPDKTAPRVAATTPKGTKAAPTVNATATFSEAMRPATTNRTTVKLVKRGSRASIPATVTYNAAARRATLNPARNLAFGAFYTATVTTGARDLAGNSLAAGKTWTFKVKPRPKKRR